MEIHKITIICPYDDSLPLQVTSYRAFMPRYGLLVVATALIEAGYDVKTYCELSGSKIDWRRVADSDIVCFSLMSFSSHKGYAYADRIRAESPDTPIVFGGSHASVLPEDCLKHCDYVIRNEGEAIILELLETLKNGGDVSGVKGVSYIGSNDRAVHNPSAGFVSKLDMIADPGIVEGYTPRSLLYYLKDTIHNGVLRFNIAVVQSSRGCPFECRFCFVKHELGRKYRTKEPELVVREIELSFSRLKTKYVFFADNDVTLDRERALEIFRLMEQRFGGDVDMFFFARIFIARDEELMHAIERAGRACIGVGIESLQSSTLDFFEKKQSIGDIEECLEIFGRFDVKLQPLFIFGSDDDDENTIDRALALVLKHGVYNWGFGSLYDFPTRERVLGAPQALPDDRFIHRDWRFYSGNFVVHYPAKMRPSTLQRKMSESYRIFYGKNKKSFYQYHPIQATYKYYIPFLEKAEEGLYNSDGTLRTDLLPGSFSETYRLDMPVSRIAVIGELARFYLGNMTRVQSWKYLLSLMRKKR